MKFSALTLLAASGAMASIAERQVAAIVSVVNGINQQTGDLDTAVKGFSGDPKTLLAATQKLQDAVTAGVSSVNAASSITLTDAVQIQGQVQNLQSTIESVVNDLISKKEALVSAGQGQTVYQSLQEQLTGAKGLQAAITSKVPPEVKTLATTLSAGINTSLEKGIDAFKDTPAGSSSGSSSSSSSSGSSPASGSSSSSGSSPASPASGASGASSGSSGSSSGSSGSSSGSSGSGSTGAKPAVATSSVPKPATYTGAASARAFSGVLAGAVALCAVVFAL